MQSTQYNALYTDGAFPDWPRRVQLRVANGMYLIACVCLVMLRIATYWLPGSAWSGAMQIAFEMGAMLFLPMYYATKHPGARATMRFRPIAPRSACLIAIAAIVGVLFANYLATLWRLLLEGLGLTNSATISYSANPVMRILIMAILPGVCEEVFFRGMVLSAWERYGATRALVVSSCLFAGLHASLDGLAVQWALGLALGYIVLCTDSVWAGALYHVLHNAALVVLSWLFGGAQSNVSVYDAIGGMPGVWLTVVVFLLLGGLYLAVLSLFGRERRRVGRPLACIATADRTSMGTPAFVYLTAGLVTVACMYVLDGMRLAGVL